MLREADDLYLNHILARLYADYNVWWSLANEYDLPLSSKCEGQKLSGLEQILEIIAEYDSMVI